MSFHSGPTTRRKAALSMIGKATLSTTEKVAVSTTGKATVSSTEKVVVPTTEKATLPAIGKASLRMTEKATLPEIRKVALTAIEKAKLTATEKAKLSATGKSTLPTTGNVVPSGGNGVKAGNSGSVNSQRLRVNPYKNHKPESYEDLKLDFSPLIFSNLERYLPMNMLNAPRDNKFKYMNEILHDYLPPEERIRAQKQKEYKQKIISQYPPMHKELYTMNPTMFFVPEFLKALKDNKEQSFRRIISEPTPGIFVFEMLQPHFCQLLVSEVENFERWIHEAKIRIMRPNTMNKYGVVLDDFGFQTMLDKLMEDFICPLSKVFFAEVGGSTLDSHHGFIVEYGNNRDTELGFHVDDSEVTLNVCLGREFSGGELFFRGKRCDKHKNTESRSGEVFDYSHYPGQAVLHHGRHRHGARATTSGYRANLVLWCRSSVFREMKRYQRGFTRWCGECNHEKEEKERLAVANTHFDFFGRGGETSG